MAGGSLFEDGVVSERSSYHSVKVNYLTSSSPALDSFSSLASWTSSTGKAQSDVTRSCPQCSVVTFFYTLGVGLSLKQVKRRLWVWSLLPDLAELFRHNGLQRSLSAWTTFQFLVSTGTVALYIWPFPCHTAAKCTAWNRECGLGCGILKPQTPALQLDYVFPTCSCLSIDPGPRLLSVVSDLSRTTQPSIVIIAEAQFSSCFVLFNHGMNELLEMVVFLGCETLLLQRDFRRGHPHILHSGWVLYNARQTRRRPTSVTGRWLTKDGSAIGTVVSARSAVRIDLVMDNQKYLPKLFPFFCGAVIRWIHLSHQSVWGSNFVSSMEGILGLIRRLFISSSSSTCSASVLHFHSFYICHQVPRRSPRHSLGSTNSIAHIHSLLSRHSFGMGKFNSQPQNSAHYHTFCQP